VRERDCQNYIEVYDILHPLQPMEAPRPIRTTPIEPGYSYHSETNMDIMQPVFDELAKTYSRLGLPLRSIENEWGPGQLDCTFAARPALDVLLTCGAMAAVAVLFLLPLRSPAA